MSDVIELCRCQSGNQQVLIAMASDFLFFSVMYNGYHKGN